jgi:hypothetical protein
MKMVSMKRSASDRREAEAVYAGSSTEEYSYGLCVNLSEEEIEKLGIGLPKVGRTFELHALVEVKSVSKSDDASSGERRSVSLQITDMALGTAKAPSDTIYGS